MRYQECGWLRRLWRQRWAVWYTFAFLWWVARWIKQGMRTMDGWSRWDELRCMWGASRGSAEWKMNHVWTLEEAMQGCDQ